jgi:hypothetical protein
MQNQPPTYSSSLLPQHIAKLIASGVSPDVAAARGYQSALDKAQLNRHGYKNREIQPPGLIIRLHGVTGRPGGYQYRPDHPRTVRGKIVKYETPPGQANAIDVPPGVLPVLGDPAVPLLLTEGPIKADSAWSAGLACVALLGVWNWRHTNTRGGKVVLPDFETIALNDGRRVVLAFDSDAHTNANVHEAMRRLAAFLASRGAEVLFLYLPPGEYGVKQGLDDYLGAGHTTEELWGRVSDELRPLPGTAGVPKDDYSDLSDEPLCDLLNDVVVFIERFVVFPSSTYSDVLALWIAHCHVYEAFSTSPRLLVVAPTILCGKTRVLEIIEALASDAELNISVSASYVFRSIEAGARIVVLQDQYEDVWRDESPNGRDLKAIYDAGYRKGSTVGRVEQVGNAFAVRRFLTFCPVALAGIGWLPESLASRSIRFGMERRSATQPVDSWDRDVLSDEMTALRRRLGAWAERHGTELERMPVLPAGIENRDAELWRPLVSIANLAGGHWPGSTAAACVELVRAAAEQVEDRGAELLGHIRDVFDGADLVDENGKGVHSPVDALHSAELVARLNAREGWPWGALRGGPLTPQGLARLLKPFGIKSASVRAGAQKESRQGYQRVWFTEAWRRYGRAQTSAPPPNDPTDPTDPTSQARGQKRMWGQNPTDPTDPASDNAATRDVGDVGDVGPVPGSNESRSRIDLDAEEEA